MVVEMKPSEVLRKARELITPEGAWTQRALARDIEGLGIGSNSRYAVCWCSYGAMEVAVGHIDTQYLEAYLNMAIGIEHDADETIATWNDDKRRTQSEVLAKFDEAAALAEARGR